MAQLASPKRRLQKELYALEKNPQPGLSLHSIGENFRDCIIDIKGVQGTVYENATFQVQFKFSDNYPFLPPAVKFVGGNIPRNSQVRRNGDVRSSILLEDWSPAYTVEVVCMSLLSMLSSYKR